MSKRQGHGNHELTGKEKPSGRSSMGATPPPGSSTAGQPRPTLPGPGQSHEKAMTK